MMTMYQYYAMHMHVSSLSDFQSDWGCCKWRHPICVPICVKDASSTRWGGEDVGHLVLRVFLYPPLSDVTSWRGMAFVTQCTERKRKLEEAAAVAAEKEAHQARQRGFMAAGQKLKSKTAAFQPSSDSHLNQDVWITILKLLCDDIEFDGVRGASVVARDLCNVRTVNKELYRFSMPALQHLNAVCSPIKDKSMNNACYSYMREISKRQDLMQPLISDPASLSASDLKTIWRGLYWGNRGTKTKATMAMDSFSAIGLKFHTSCPAQLFLVLAEKKEERPDLTKLIGKVKAEPSYVRLHDYHAFEARVECMKLGLTTMDALKTAAAKAEKSCPLEPWNFMPFHREHSHVSLYSQRNKGISDSDNGGKATTASPLKEDLRLLNISSTCHVAYKGL